MTVWAMLIVEWAYPRVQSLHDNEGLFEDCEQCVRATSSVMNANLLLFKTVIAGDSWGLIAVPVIEHYPATALLFMGSLLTLVFGVLNLIVAAAWCIYFFLIAAPKKSGWRVRWKHLWPVLKNCRNHSQPIAIPRLSWTISLKPDSGMFLNLAEEMEDNLDKDTKLLEEPQLKCVYVRPFSARMTLFHGESSGLYPIQCE